jgi:hypothetical protein
LENDCSIKGLKEGEVNIIAFVDKKIIKRVPVSIIIPRVESITADLEGNLSKVGETAGIFGNVIMNHPSAPLATVTYTSSNLKVV